MKQPWFWVIVAELLDFGVQSTNNEISWNPPCGRGGPEHMNSCFGEIFHMTEKDRVIAEKKKRKRKKPKKPKPKLNFKKWTMNSKSWKKLTDKSSTIWKDFQSEISSARSLFENGTKIMKNSYEKKKKKALIDENIKTLFFFLDWFLLSKNATKKGNSEDSQIWSYKKIKHRSTPSNINSSCFLVMTLSVCYDQEIFQISTWSNRVDFEWNVIQLAKASLQPDCKRKNVESVNELNYLRKKFRHRFKEFSAI